mgnify:CR=1 FL=1
MSLNLEQIYLRAKQNKKTLICTELFLPEELEEISKYTEIIDINAEDALGGLTNSVRMGNMILCASNISEMKKSWNS